MDSLADDTPEMSPPKRPRVDGQDAVEAGDEERAFVEKSPRIRIAEDLDDDDIDEDLTRDVRRRTEPRDARIAVSESICRKENLRPPMEHEIEFLLKDPKSYKTGQSVHSEARTLHGSFTFRLLVFPMGTEVTSPTGQLAAFVEAMQPPGCEDIRWAFEGVRYQITVVNWKDYRKSVSKQDNFTFTREHSDRGWHHGFVKVKLMFERDLMKMKGFWPMPDEFPITETMKISRDDHTEELLRDALELPPLAQAQVQEEHIALFVLTQRKTRQLRFKYLPLSDALKCHTTDTHLTVLVMVSQGYDPQTLEPGGDSEEVPHQLSNWTEELILLVVKYFCPVKQVIVTLGCYYSELSEPLKAMLHPSSPWLAQRLLPYVQRGEVADPPAAQWQCWEEWGRAPKEIKPLNIEKSMKEEGLYCGDVVIWQPLSACGPRRPGADEEEVLPTVRDFAELCMNHLRVMVRLMSAEAPLCPEGIPSQLELGQPLPPGLVRPISEATEGSQEVPGQVTCLEMTIDVRWHTDQLARKILQALQLEQAEGKRFWVFDSGAPSASRNAAMYHSKALCSKVESGTVASARPACSPEHREGRPALGTTQVWPVLFAWFGFTLVGLSTSCNAYRHLLNFTRPDLQPHVLRIILVGPIYAFSASLCLSMSESACFFVRSVRDIWEAVVIYSFLTLIIEYMGGEHLCLHSISQNDEAVPHLFPFSLCLPPIATGSMIRVPKMGALQFVAVKPIVAVISIVVYACGQLHNWYYQWTLFVIYNISYSVALYALYLIYWSSHEQEALQSKRPLLKFVSVKMIVFLTFWQALLLPLAPLPGSSSRWEDFILSIEMIIFGVLMNIAFTWREFSTAAPCAPRLGQGAGGCVDLMDLDAKPPGNPQDAQSGAPECKDSEGSPPSSELAGAVKVHGFRGSWSLSRNRRTKHA
ncbi:unnamed protein product [Effrenium voratum]|nr:unnamed protein product [Effrenium voratum]